MELERCTLLVDVVLSFNRLTAIPPVLYTLKRLENIIANDNQVIRISNQWNTLVRHCILPGSFKVLVEARI